jgi:putative exporter of polyketide antibiotics
VLAALLLACTIVALGIAAGLVPTGEAATTPVLGTSALALYAFAIAGIGFAVGVLFGPSSAMPAALAVVTANILIDILVPALRLPLWMQNLALTSHFGEPMLGAWDLAGVVLCCAIAVGGTALGALGFTRRDLVR